VRFAHEGAKLVIADIDRDAGERTAAEIKRNGGEVVFIRTDTASAAANDAMAQAALDEYGRLDVLIASAGISHAAYDSTEPEAMRRSHPRRPIIDKPLEEWERVIRVNLTGVMLGNQAAARRMIKAGNCGSIVNVSSIAAIMPAVVRKNSTTLMQRGPRGCTRGEVRSGRSVPQLGSIGRNDAAGVGTARGDSGVGREGRAPRKSVVGLDCNAPAKTTEFFEDAARSRG
jgi:NAD(P)-dependent dehydrogenase (short-subunit alcohol dehydrogenase family)